jgi:hypothetical protein
LASGQDAAASMFYSKATNTVLMTDPVSASNVDAAAVFEFDTAGQLIRSFHLPLTRCSVGIAANRTA